MSVSESELDEIKPGTKLDVSFASCTVCKEMATGFTEHNKIPVLLCIKTDPKNYRDISQFSNYPTEKEMMFLDNVSLNIVSVEKVDSTYVVNLE